ncbi:hypothetical protein [Burkholderia cenocepacia]|uniref:hypothetical protein n=1 Tax=Burkholderia cenocepacia TaxID=95486 RepID=UPI001BA82C13|nr:hypothetical protein [Burkholderia cenocepacia]QUN38659.1 hypothetical protein KEH56_10555 [Burkholderia cenocepacia]QUO29438.1 hypothetical protein KEH57_23420 [Burkholderia cenocepacia]
MQTSDLPLVDEAIFGILYLVILEKSMRELNDEEILAVCGGCFFWRPPVSQPQHRTGPWWKPFLFNH